MVRFAVVGCTHGAFDALYAHIDAFNADAAVRGEAPISAVLLCGDVQCLRNEEDLKCKASPPRYRRMNEFPEYYTGAKRASVLTIFIGGNHEASNYLQELHYGGWVAPNMLYLGAAGVVNVAGVRIAGYSGIYDAKDYEKGHYERVPYTKKSLYSVFHTRAMQIHQLAHLARGSIDILMSHDWPRKIEDHGDLAALLAQRPDFQASIDKDTFGSPGGEYLLHRLRPRHWVAGHMHVRFEARVAHDDTNGLSETKFLALDKCVAGRPWFEVIDVSPSLPMAEQSLGVQVHCEWLAILRATQHTVLSRSSNSVRLPREPSRVTEDEIEWVRQRLQQRCAGVEASSCSSSTEWFTRFEMTAPPFGHEDELWTDGPLGNPQTDALLTLLELPHVVTTPYRSRDLVDDGSLEDEDDAETKDDNDAYLESLGCFQFGET
ncbi:hypothetical protein PINS_up006514 [Pythium insidiosum]|nr:hypothetical protein PINS_up006514 [Pythium insidiosum]